MGIVTLSDVKSYLNLTDTSHDTVLQSLIDAVSAVSNEVSLTVQTFTETHRPTGSTIMLDNVPVQSVTSVTEYVGRVAYTLTSQPPGSTTDNYGYSLDLPDAGLLVRRSSAGTEMPFIGTPVVVVYTAGLATIPADLKMAVLFDIEGLYQSGQLGPVGALGAFNADAALTTPTGRPVSMWPRVDAWVASRFGGILA